MCVCVVLYGVGTRLKEGRWSKCVTNECGTNDCSKQCALSFFYFYSYVSSGRHEVEHVVDRELHSR